MSFVHPFHKIRSWLWTTEQKPLSDIAIQLAQPYMLNFGLDPFGNDLLTQ